MRLLTAAAQLLKSNTSVRVGVQVGVGGRALHSRLPPGPPLTALPAPAARSVCRRPQSFAGVLVLMSVFSTPAVWSGFSFNPPFMTPQASPGRRGEGLRVLCRARGAQPAHRCWACNCICSAHPLKLRIARAQASSQAAATVSPAGASRPSSQRDLPRQAPTITNVAGTNAYPAACSK